MGRTCSTNGGAEECIQDIGRKARRKETQLGRPRRMWVHNIKIDLKEIGWDDMDRIVLAQDRDKWRALVNMIMNFRVP
jgi:hypothetical protein